MLCALTSATVAAGESSYPSAQAAFEATFIASGLGQRGYDENREYAAALYEMPDGRWYATAVAKGGRVASAIPYHLVPSSAIRVAGAHTHGQPTLPEDPSRIYGTDFSETDRRNAVLAYRQSHGRIDSQILLNSNLDVIGMTISPEYQMQTGRITTVARVGLLFSLNDRITQ